jgi:hypothetical protein
MNKQTEEALKMAISAMQVAASQTKLNFEQTINACKEALEQPAQEPVGQLCLGCGSSWSNERLNAERERNPELISCCPDRQMVDVFTHPAQPLSDDEIGKLFSEFIASHHTPSDSFKVIAGFARAIEQAHGIGVKDA